MQAVKAPISNKGIIGGYFLPRESSEQSERNIEIDYSEFLEKGIFKYKPLKGIVKPGIQYITHDIIPESNLEFERKGRIASTAGAVALNLIASVGLLYSGSKLLLNSIFGKGQEEDAYQSLGSAYTKSSIAGVLTGLAHESPSWAIGNLGMGISSRFLHNILGLAGFLFSDGLASVGMGEVRYREKGNAFNVQNSIFNNRALSYLSFLKPIEQSIYSFAKKAVNPKEWKLFKEAEPYALFNSAGGGLITAGGLLGIAAIFKNKLSDKLQSFAYLPASIFSIANLIAFYRDGAIEVDRSNYIGGGKRKGENYTQRVEGYCKQIASPFLGLRNLLFAFKGVGLDTSGRLHNTAIGMQAFGAAFAFLGFTAQSFLKFFKPELFGPKLKQFIEIILEPKIAAKHLNKLMKFLKTKSAREIYEPQDNITSKLVDTILNDKHSAILTKIMESDSFTPLYDKSQAGFPNYTNEKTYPRFYLDRGSHSVRTCGIGIRIYGALIRNTKDKELLDFLHKNEMAFKIACLLHDLGHGPFSHVLDKALPGHDNDQETIKLIRDSNSRIHQTILRACSESKIDGNIVISNILEILGRDSTLYKLLSGWGADRIDYIRFSDFPTVNNGRVLFPQWEIKDLDNYVETFRLYKDTNGKIRTGFTPEGALIAFLMCSDREMFDVMLNGSPSSLPIDLLASIALADKFPNDIKDKTEDEVAEIIFNNIENLKRGESVINSKQYKGGRNGYSYYSSIQDDPTCINVVNGSVSEFLSYLKKHGIKNFLDEVVQRSAIFKKHLVTEQELISRIKAATTLHEIYTRVHVRN